MHRIRVQPENHHSGMQRTRALNSNKDRVRVARVRRRSDRRRDLGRPPEPWCDTEVVGRKALGHGLAEVLVVDLPGQPRAQLVRIHARLATGVTGGCRADGRTYEQRHQVRQDQYLWQHRGRALPGGATQGVSLKGCERQI